MSSRWLPVALILAGLWCFAQAQEGKPVGPNPPAGLFTTTGALKGNGSGTISQAATTDLSDVTGKTAWTPTDGSGASLTFTAVNAGYTKLGNMVFAYFTLTYPSTANGSNASIAWTVMPAVPNQSYGFAAHNCYTSVVAVSLGIETNVNTSTASFVNLVGGSAVTNVTLSLKQIYCYMFYPTT